LSVSEETTGPAGPRIIVALDFADADAARSLVERLDPKLCRVKVGKELFTRAGPQFVSGLVGAGYDVFLDLKFHDIPNTVARACAAAADLGVWMLNVHALGGRRMMESARQALESASRARPLLIAVTVLTSLDQADLGEIGLKGTPAENVERLAALAQSSGLDGVVCSAQEAAGLRASRGEGFALVTPGIRPSGAARGDQKRVMTPGEAVRAGSHYLVVGRPVTQAEDPLASLAALNRDIAV
jgi:orotidine-5'-phosphate decarboxylase